MSAPQQLLAVRTLLYFQEKSSWQGRTQKRGGTLSSQKERCMLLPKEVDLERILNGIAKREFHKRANLLFSPYRKAHALHGAFLDISNIYLNDFLIMKPLILQALKLPLRVLGCHVAGFGVPCSGFWGAMQLDVFFCFEGDTLSFWLSKLEACALVYG